MATKLVALLIGILAPWENNLDPTRWKVNDALTRKTEL